MLTALRSHLLAPCLPRWLIFLISQGSELSLPVEEAAGASVSERRLLFPGAALCGGRRFSANPRLLELWQFEVCGSTSSFCFSIYR